MVFALDLRWRAHCNRQTELETKQLFFILRYIYEADISEDVQFENLAGICRSGEKYAVETFARLPSEAHKEEDFERKQLLQGLERVCAHSTRGSGPKAWARVHRSERRTGVLKRFVHQHQPG